MTLVLDEDVLAAAGHTPEAVAAAVRRVTGAGAVVRTGPEEAKALAEERGVPVEIFARRGDPADAILDVAEEQGADLIVVGNKGMTGAKRFLLGSVPNKISHHAPCSVLIIRTV